MVHDDLSPSLLSPDIEGILQQLVDGVILSDVAGRITFVNEAANRMHGVAELGVPVERYSETYHLLTMEGVPYPPEDLPLARAVRRAETVVDARWRIRRPDGCERIVQGNARPLYNQTGRQQGAILTIRDVTDQVHAEEQAVREAREKEAMIAARDNAEQELRNSERRFRTMIEQAPYSIQVFSLEGKTRLVNRAWEQLWGITLEQLSDYNVLTDPQLEEKGIASYIRRGFAGEPTPIPPIHYDPNGTIAGIEGNPDAIRWVEAFIYPVKDEAGSIREVILVHEDVTARWKAAMEIKDKSEQVAALNERLKRSIRETHHRVKNNLQVISALAELQIVDNKEQVPATALLRISQHTRALATLHDLLTQEAKADPHIDAISTQAAFAKLLPVLQATLGERHIHATVEDFRLPIQAASSLSLLVSELISNAFKHGQGDITLTLTTDSDQARLEVCDSGPGFPAGFAWETAANTGLALIDSVGRYDLRGRLSFENRSEVGARVVVTFPVSLPHPI